MMRARKIITTCLLAGLLLVAASCDDTFIDPFDNDGQFYTIYGFIDQAKNFEQRAGHAVRVIPVTRFPERVESTADAQASIDATVTSTDLRTGQTIRWRHSLEQLDDDGKLYSYSIISSPLPVANYKSTIRLEEGESGCVVTWESDFEPSGAPESDAVNAISGVYQAGFDNLKKMFGG